MQLFYVAEDFLFLIFRLYPAIIQAPSIEYDKCIFTSPKAKLGWVIKAHALSYP
jgi:hypothetical protein